MKIHCLLVGEQLIVADCCELPASPADGWKMVLPVQLTVSPGTLFLSLTVGGWRTAVTHTAVLHLQLLAEGQMSPAQITYISNF
jgi:hypothetical protein